MVRKWNNDNWNNKTNSHVNNDDNNNCDKKHKNLLSIDSLGHRDRKCLPGILFC